MVVATGETSGWHYYSLWMMCHLFSAKQPIPTLEIAAGIIRHSANSPNSDNSIMRCLTLGWGGVGVEWSGGGGGPGRGTAQRLGDDERKEEEYMARRMEA